MALETHLGLIAFEHAVNVACMRIMAFKAEPFAERHVVVANGLGFHETGVAPRTKRSTRGLKEIFVVRSMRTVTDITLRLGDGIVDNSLLKGHQFAGVAGVAQGIYSLF